MACASHHPGAQLYGRRSSNNNNDSNRGCWREDGHLLRHLGKKKKIMWWAPHRGALIGGRAWLVWILILIFLPQRVCACIDSQAAEKRLPSSWPSCAGNFSSLSNVGRVNRGTAGQNEGESHHRPRTLYTLN